MLVSADPAALSAHAVEMGSLAAVLAGAAESTARLRGHAAAAGEPLLAEALVELLTRWSASWAGLADAADGLAGLAALRAEAFRVADGGPAT